jgi:hypothetical protein
VIDLQALLRDRDQLWAEALVRFRSRAPWWLETPELQALAAAEQDARFEVDAWTERVNEWLVDRRDVSVGEILFGALDIAGESWSQTAQSRVAKILIRLGFERYRPGEKRGRERRDTVGRDRSSRLSAPVKISDRHTLTSLTLPGVCCRIIRRSGARPISCSMASAPLLPIDRGAWRDC